MLKKCTTCGQEFTIDNREQEQLEIKDLNLPDECPVCIWKNLLAFWVFGSFRKGTSDLSGKPIITNLPTKTRFPVYSRDEWMSDVWDPLSYGKIYNPNRPFFDQFKELQEAVPHPHQYGANNINCDWCDDIVNCKDCYLCRSLLESEFLSYSYRAFRCKNSIDLMFCFDSELCYDCTYCFNCYKVKHSVDARNCLDSNFLYDCRNCTYCFLSWNLRNKQYCIENIQHDKQTYNKKIKELTTGSYAGWKKIKDTFDTHIKNDAIHHENYNTKVTNSTGNYLEECKDCANCYFVQRSESCAHIFRGISCKDAIYNTGTISEKAIYSSVDAYLYDTVATSHNNNCRYSYYLDFCDDCEYCFGCVGLRKKKYCMLNTVLGKDAYEKEIDRVKQVMKKEGSWSKFFPLNLAYCGYNNSIANAYFKETYETIKKRGGLWDNEEQSMQSGISTDEIPDSVLEVQEEFCTKAIFCFKTKKRFNIAPRELTFLKEHAIHIPREHPDWRALNRFKILGNTTPNQAFCFFCKTPILHFYPTDLNYKKISCQSCYQKNLT